MDPKVGVLQVGGTNCDRETKELFDRVGGDAGIVHLNAFKKGHDTLSGRDVSLDDYHILAIPGGFSYGDYISAGQVFSHELIQFQEEIQKFIEDGKLMIGICNGFQTLTKAGFLPGYFGQQQTASLAENDSGNYECRWLNLTSPPNNCIWTQGVEQLQLPIGHAEGKFITPYSKDLFENGNVVFQYADGQGNPTMEFPQNPNGSIDSIAGICDDTGQVFGLMPHPERYNSPWNHPDSPLQEILKREYVDETDPAIAKRIEEYGTLPEEGGGVQIFRNAVEYVRNNLE